MSILFLGGFVISSTNPITLAYFASAALGPLTGSGQALMASAAAIVVLTMLRSLGVAGLAGSACVRRAFGAQRAIFRASGAILLAALGGLMIWPCLSMLSRFL